MFVIIYILLFGENDTLHNFLYLSVPVLIQRILIGFEATIEKKHLLFKLVKLIFESVNKHDKSINTEIFFMFSIIL